nr:hypothetical protein [Tanacetum cinerariifolium]
MAAVAHPGQVVIEGERLSIAREVEAAYPGPPVYCTRALYLARKLDALVGFALLALEELEADPLVCGPLAFEAAPDTDITNKAPVTRDTGTRVDSLNGIPGHQFGELLSAFPGLVAVEGSTEPGYATYYYPVGNPQEKGWFGKHHREIGSVFYRFHAGRFANFRAVAYGAEGKNLLRQETIFLLGKGKTGLDRTEWLGRRAWAVYTSPILDGESVEQLDIISALRDRQPMSRYRFIEAQRAAHPVRLLCQVGVPTSGYYAWQQAVVHGESAWETALVKVFGHHQRRYGTRRLQVALRRKGYRVGRQRLLIAMRRRGLHALQPESFTSHTTDWTHGLRYAPNRLLNQPKPMQANQIGVSDTTYLPLANGDWTYL